MTSIDLMKENGFKMAKERSWKYIAQTIMDADYVDDIMLLANSPTPGERAAGGIDLHVDSDKTEYMYFNQRRHHHTKVWSSETGGQVHLHRKQRLINREWHQHATSKGMDSYW